MSLLRKFCYWLLSVYILNGIVAYHFDSDNAILFEDPAEIGGSYFGFSVALWRPGESPRDNKNSIAKNRTIFVGAPRANYISDSGIETNKSGNIYNCEIDGAKCEAWKLTRDTIFNTGAWVGGSLAVADSPVFEALICAPNWISWLEMKGMCYLVKSESNADPVSHGSMTAMIMEGDKNVTYSQYEQCGLSIDTIPKKKNSPENPKYISGCPGMYNWRGTPMFLVAANDLVVPNVTKNGLVTEDSLSGYAVKSGRYFSEKRSDFATGAPRADGLRGTVTIFKYNKRSGYPIKPEINITGEQIGEYFGSVLASCDIDGDGTDELLVGAPRWTEISDEGRIYIYKLTRSRRSCEYKKLQHIGGTKIKGRFGSTITCLEDIDRDGYGDVAVGAPYDGNGTVHIYHGGKGGVLTSTQNISGPSGARGFGLSISKPLDIDSNGYADIAVGAPLSGHVFLIMSRCVVKTEVTLNTSLLNNQLSNDAKNFTISVCCSGYAGPDAPPELNVTRVLKIDDIHRRAYFNVTGEPQPIHRFNDTLKVDEGKSCQHFEVYLRDNNHEFSDFKVSVTQHMSMHDEIGGPIGAVMNKTNQEYHLNIMFVVECGSGPCNSALSTHINITNLKTVSPYVIGSQQSIDLNIIVSNVGDPAYFTEAIISMPSFVKLIDGPSACRKRDNDQNGQMVDRTVVECSIVVCLNKDAIDKVTLRLDMSSVPSDTTEIRLEANATTRSEGTPKATEFIIGCVAGADIGIAGETEKDSHRFTLEKVGEQSLGIQFNHTYEIRSYKSTLISEAILRVSFPTIWIHGGHRIAVLSLTKTITDLGGMKFDCVDRADNSVSSNENAYTTTQWLIGNEYSSIPQTETKFQVHNGKVFSTCADNETFFINTTNPEFEWRTIDCKLGPLNSSQPTARLDIVFDLLLQNFTPEMIGDKDMIFFVTNGSASITDKQGIVQTIDNKPDSMLVGTRFNRTTSTYGKPPAAWILPVSVGVGLVFLVLISIGLVKYGFFRRDKKAELEALKEEMHNTFPTVVILDNFSSTEILNTILNEKY